ncbi:MAG: Eco57I restriction-modification methylase domain-containing protein [Armatimonadota bacterium]
MPDSQLSLHLPAHQNRQLFSDHYLNEILPTQAGWRALTAQAATALAEITGIFNRFVPSENERQTEDNLVCPVLHALGHTFEVQAPLKTPDGTKVPDYVFYRDDAALAAHKNLVLTDAVATDGAFAVGDAKYWNRPLDIAVRTKGADALSNKNPAFQIYFYMLHSGVEWGILTNGRLWRLYHRDSAHKLDVCYEVDLEELVRSGDVQRFMYFYAFFRRAAFEPGPLCLADLLRASVEYAHGVGATLKSQVYDALRHLAQGFLDYPGNGLQPAPEVLKETYDNSLILLYRLIFILYAEARELLPVRESELYRETYSLLAIKQAVARGRHLLPTSARLWPQLTELFGFINKGEPPLHIATFNGGLFDPVKHPFLEQYAVGDAHLQQAIDMLARVNGEFIDYRDLTVRHMGTIYEGLLEFKLVPCAPAAGWSVDLVNDKGERKATGSYYTPEYIVKFIVEQTVGPVLWEAVSGKSSDADIVHAVLTVNVLDPAMGSGHFLVEATEYIARFLVDYGILPEGKTAEEADLAYWKRRVVQSCIYGVDLNPLAVELAKLSLWLITVAKDRPLSFLDHHLRPGNSLVGARLTALQQHSETTAKTARKKKAAPVQVGQSTLFADADFTQRMAVAVGSMWLIEENEAASVEQVKEQEHLYADLRRQLVEKYGKLADLLTAQHFGVAVPADQWAMVVDHVMGRSLGLPPTLQAVLTQVDAIAVRERFFHWELEFPELYFDRYGRPLGDDGGFEAVIGNPPYVRQEQLAPYKPYFQQDYADVYHGVADLFVYFFAQGLRQARTGGRLSYISSNSWLRANYATPLRKFLREETTVDILVDVGDNRVFEEAPDVYPAVHVVRKAVSPAEHQAQAAIFTRGEGVSRFAAQVANKLFPVSMHDQEDSGWQLGDDAGRQLFRKLMTVGKPLGEVVDGRLYRGVLTGLNEAFIIDRKTRDRLVAEDLACAAILKKMLRGEDLRPWYQEDEGRWLIFTRRGIDINAYPAVKAYLEPFRERLEPKPADWDETHPWPGRKPGNYQWYEIQDTVEYYAALEQPKIFWPDITKLPRFVWDESGAFIGNTGYFIPDVMPFMLAILTSRLTWFAISNLGQPLGERAGSLRYRLFTQTMERLPIPAMSDTDRTALGALAMEITNLARTRYALHGRVRHRLHSDFGTPDKALNNKLTAWWTLDFPALRAELQKVFKRDIPLKDRDEVEAWLATQRADHARLTAEIVTRETDLNARVYALFGLTDDEIALIEESTKYRYGEV